MATPRNHPFTGCMTALVTPFRNGKVDDAALAKLVDWQIEQGVDAIVSVGTTGESATLDVEEHVEVIAQTVKAARGRVPVIAGAGANATREALELSKAAADVGASGLLHVTPYYNKPTQDGLYRHFETVAASTSLPVVLYNVPGRTAVDMLPDTVERLAAVDNIVGIKEATANMARAAELVARVGHRMAIIAGDDDTAFTMYALGGHGVISVTSNVVPREMSEMWDAAARGDWDRARTLHYKVRALNAALFCETNPIPVKAAVALLGRCANELRAPMYPAQPSTVERLKKVMTAEGWL
jgi:4-hydroxy-tetrahydrodipicolinate synthase